MVSVVIESRRKMELVKRALLSHLVLTTNKVKGNERPPATQIDIEVADTEEMIEVIDTKLKQLGQEQE